MALARKAAYSAPVAEPIRYRFCACCEPKAARPNVYVPPSPPESAGIIIFPEIARTMNGVAMMKPFAIRTIIKKGKSAPMFGAPSGSPSSVIREPDMPVMVEKIPAIIIGYIANETTAESHRAK